ncbi:unnamed protein product [Lactuca virosa]|uniref:Uncharacterized protein n=1 Tax=Lactuca virosa TaxID=75947 RepID=A0AAU9PN67_9ASTR|nr:unnamed protein product [Lactuca virosa]
MELRSEEIFYSVSIKDKHTPSVLVRFGEEEIGSRNLWRVVAIDRKGGNNSSLSSKEQTRTVTSLVRRGRTKRKQQGLLKQLLSFFCHGKKCECGGKRWYDGSRATSTKVQVGMESAKEKEKVRGGYCPLVCWKISTSGGGFFDRY